MSRRRSAKAAKEEQTQDPAATPGAGDEPAAIGLAASGSEQRMGVSAGAHSTSPESENGQTTSEPATESTGAPGAEAEPAATSLAAATSLSKEEPVAVEAPAASGEGPTPGEPTAAQEPSGAQVPPGAEELPGAQVPAMASEPKPPAAEPDPMPEPPPGVIRTPDERFDDLPGYPFAAHYAVVRAEGTPPLRMHYVDEGPSDGPVVLLLHGQPTWSYLYRRVIPVLSGAGRRVIAPDLVGYGRSDKPTERTDYTLERHIQWVSSLLQGLDLTGITLVAQDWGGPIGLSALARDPDRFARVVVSNTILHTSEPTLAGRLTWANHALGDGRVVLEEALVDYVLFSIRTPEYSASFFVDAVSGPLPKDVKDAYDAPFPDPRYQAGVRQMSALIPLTRNDPGAEIGRSTMAALELFPRPFLTAYTDGDPASRGWDTVLQGRVLGARGQAHVTIRDAGHFVQEQRGERLASVINDFIESTPEPGAE